MGMLGERVESVVKVVELMWIFRVSKWFGCFAAPR